MTTLNVLYAEDNEGDVQLAQECLKLVDAPIQLHRVENGSQCLAFLRKDAPFEASPDVDVVLLDLKMPVMGGLEVLARLRDDPSLPETPVVVFTTSSHPDDIRRCYQLRCSGYMVKPFDFDGFIMLVRRFSEYWGEAVSLPSRVRPLP
jgi:CheY-like chemotaxis protein